MKRIDLEIEHRYKNRFVGRHRLQESRKLVVIGNAQSAAIRLLGEDVSPIHAYVEWREGAWALTDAGSERGTWLDKKPITSQPLTADTIIQIGGHELVMRPRLIEQQVFAAERLGGCDATGKTPYHQVIVQRNGHTLSTELLAADEPFHFSYLDQNHAFAAPKSGEVCHHEVGPFHIHQRYVLSGVVAEQPQNWSERLMGREVRAAALGVFALLFIVGLIMVSLPQQNDAELTPPKIDENKFTRMIFDANLVKQKRAEARERQKKIMARSGGINNTAGAKSDNPGTQVRSSGSTPKVIGKLKMSGLQALLGKISARAAKNSVKIAGAGSVGSKGSARSTASAAVGSLQGVTTEAGNGGPTYKVGAVGTVGKGGGKSVKGVGGLALGGVGSASVGIIDEETEIEGGLDKDVIARVINAQLGEIRYCYERQLAADPNIYGKVIVRFSIDAAGSVATQRVGLTTLKSAMVEGCILRRVAGWKFPKPKGGTTVLVTYPFLFKSTN